MEGLELDRHGGDQRPGEARASFITRSATPTAPVGCTPAATRGRGQDNRERRERAPDHQA